MQTSGTTINARSTIRAEGPSSVLRYNSSSARPVAPRMAAAVLALCAGLIGGCKQEVQFTRTPFAGVLEPDAKPNETTVFLSMPLELAPVTAATDGAVGEVLAKSREYVDDIACDRRKGPWIECNGAIVTTEITRAGAITVAAEGNRLILSLPVRYDINARGHGWASYLTDRKTGTATVGVPFEVALATGYRIDVRMANDLIWNVPTIPVLKGKVGLAKLADGKLKAQMRAALEPLKAAVAGPALRDSAERAWKALHMPIELTRAPSLWLRSLPERVAGAGFTSEAGSIVYRLALDARMGVHRGERPAPLFAKPMPEPARAAPARAAPVVTSLRVPLDIVAGDLQEAVAAQFPPTDVLQTRADGAPTAVKVRTLRASVFPARDKLAIELQLDVVEPARLLGLTGKAYLVGTPVLDPTSGILSIRDIGFPQAPKNQGKTPEGILRIGEEPFAGRFAAAARLDVGTALRDLVPRINTMMNQPLDETIALTGAFSDMQVVSVNPVKGGFRLNVELRGTLALRVHGLSTVSGSHEKTSAQVPPPQIQPKD